MEAKLIKGILYTELDEEVGPNPFVWLGDIPLSNRLHISVKTITVLSGESGLIPDSLVILPFPSLNFLLVLEDHQYSFFTPIVVITLYFIFGILFIFSSS